MGVTVRPRPTTQPRSVQTGRAEQGGAMSAVLDLGPYDPIKANIILRASPLEPDNFDATRIATFGQEWSSQTNTLLVRDRQIEMNVRMVCGQQWNMWHPTLGRFFDVSDWLTNDEKAWRKLPVINKLLRWYVVTHGRLTENPPILTCLPGPDRIDAEAAEVLDTLFKKDWKDAGMEDVHDELMMWLTIAGRAYAISRIDPGLGEWKPWIAAAPVPVVDENRQPVVDPNTGQPMMTPPIPNMPINADGTANAEFHAHSGNVLPLGPPHFERMGGISVDVYSPLQVRGQWGPQPWHKKTWHGVQRFLTPEQVYEWTGVEVEPDISADAAANIATLERVLYGSGFYGTAMGRMGSGWVDSNVKGPLCTIYERWQAPMPPDERAMGTWAETMIETPENPGGRHTIWSPKKMITDGPRELAWEHTSPVRCFDFVRLPGRPSGTTPLEMLLGPQRSYNQSRSQVMEQAALSGNPQTVIDEDAGIQPSQLTNQPGKIYTAARRPGVPAVEYIVAPGVSADVIKSISFAAEEIDELGGLRGTEGSPPNTEDPSGELVKELRFNADRLLGATTRRGVAEYGRMAGDWRKIYPIIYDAQTVIAINGQDNIAETITVIPDVLKNAHVNIVPDVESMLPEGRGERQARAERLYDKGVFGDPLGNDARDIFLEISRFPNYTRMARPGGVDVETARQENGKIIMGQFDQPVLDWYDHAAHLSVHERYMKRPEFLKQPPQVQMAFAMHRVKHILELQKQMAQAKQQAFEDAAIQASLAAQAKGKTDPAPALPEGPSPTGAPPPTRQPQKGTPTSGQGPSGPRRRRMPSQKGQTDTKHKVPGSRTQTESAPSGPMAATHPPA